MSQMLQIRSQSTKLIKHVHQNLTMSRLNGHDSLQHTVFIHQILLHLGLVEFPASEPIHIIAPIGATFLRQRAAYMRASSKRPRVEPSGVAPPPPSSIGDTMAEESVDPPPPSSTYVGDCHDHLGDSWSNFGGHA